MSDSKTTTGRTPSRDLPPGTRLRWRDGTEVVLDRRKNPDEPKDGNPFFLGWWLVDQGGLADFFIDNPDSGWEVVA